MRTPLIARALFAAFWLLFAVAGSYLLLDSLGIWEKLPSGLTRAVGVLSGLILGATLLGHLALASGRLPSDTVGPR